MSDQSPAVASPPFKVIGTRPLRHDGADKVTGRAQYGADVAVAGTLGGFILRSPHAHARIKSIDVGAARAMPGVHAVVIGADMPPQEGRVVQLGEGAANMAHLRANILAQDKVLYRGHAVAAVAADNAHIAEEAAKKIRVEYEPLPPVLDVRAAMAPGAPLLHPDIYTEEFGERISEKPSNVAKRFFYEVGDLDAGFAQANVIIEREFETATVHQGYIEPHTSTALWHADGAVTIWTSTQGSFTVRQQVAELLLIPQSRIKVIPMEIGGGFGGKINVYEQPVAVLLSQKTGRPVKLTMSRTDVFEATGPTPGSYLRVKLGVDKTGRITAADAHLAYEAGAYPGSPINPGCMCVFSCYDIPNARVEGFDVVVNKPRTAAYRAPGSPNAAFAMESVVDEACERLKIDPLEFRLKNAAKAGTRRVDGPVYPVIGLVECLEAARASDHWKSPIGPRPRPAKAHGPNGAPRVPLPHRPAPNAKRGRGVASGFWFNVGFKSSVTVNVSTDGQVTLIEGSTDIGGTRTSVAMQLAETLGIAVEDVHPLVADTDGVGYTDVTGGSRVTHTTGAAAHQAGLKIRDQLCQLAAKVWGCSGGACQYENGGVSGPGGQRLNFKQLAEQSLHVGEPITASASVSMDACGGAFAVHIADVEVDPDTGKVDVLRYTAIQDAGRAIHPSYVEGQMQGGAVQGIGWALNEEYWYDGDGRMRNSGFLDYRIPTSYDVPEIETIIVEVPNPLQPYGVRGVGEAPICPPQAALASAIHQAVGVRLRRLPMSPPAVLQAILDARR